MDVVVGENNMEKTEGVRVPGLPEGLEIVRISETRDNLPTGEYTIYNGDARSVGTIADIGSVVVRALPGYEIKFDGERNRNVVARVEARCKIVVDCPRDRVRILQQFCEEHKGFGYEPTPDPRVMGKVCDPGFITASEIKERQACHGKTMGQCIQSAARRARIEAEVRSFDPGVPAVPYPMTQTEMSNWRDGFKNGWRGESRPGGSAVLSTVQCQCSGYNAGNVAAKAEIDRRMKQEG